jgi:NDP-sugar pyrophosphorylase family protein
LTDSELGPVAILCGGLATRLGRLTENTAKSAVLVNGEPFLAHQLRLLAGQDVRHVVLCVGYLGDQLRAIAGDGSRFGISVHYSEDGATPLGTGGAVREALPLLGPRFFVMYGDSYLTCDFREVQRAFLSSGKPALMTVFRNENQLEPSNVDFQDGRIVLYDKTNRTENMHHVDYGLGIFSRQVFQELPAGRACDLAQIYAGLIRIDSLAGLEIPERFYEIGSVSGLAQTEAYLRRSG